MKTTPYITALTVALVVVVLAGTWNTFAPDFLPDEESEEVPADDTGRSLDPERLTDDDLAFLSGVLRQPEEPGRVSAARVLAVSKDLRGVSMLLEAHREGYDPGGAYCMAAIEILRLQTWEDSWRTLLIQMQKQPAVDSACMNELSDRFSLLGGAERARWMAEDEDPVIRAWVARALGPGDGEVLLQLTDDAEPTVRRAAWLAWDVRDSSAFVDRLQPLVEQEADPEIAALAAEVLP